MNNIKMSSEIKSLFKKLERYGIRRHDEDLYLYKYVTIDTAKIILSTSTLKFSSPSQLRDNDCEMCLLNINQGKEYIKKYKRKAAKIALASQGMPTHDIYDFFRTEKGKEFINQVSEKQVVESLIAGYEEQRSKIGLFCLTTSNDNSEMWEKYADNAKGVCIQYKFPSLFNKAFYSFTVNYDSEMKPLNLFDKQGSQLDLPLYRWLFTKRIDYKFENEIRLMSNLGEVGISAPIKEVFTGLFYGKNTLQSDIDDLESSVKNVGSSFTVGRKINC